MLAQRLVRRLCECRSCSEPSQKYIDTLSLAGNLEPVKVKAVPNGCDACDSTGYKGRIGIYEMLVFNDAIRAAARSENASDQIRTLARHNGMKFMQEYALAHVAEGMTTLIKVQRVVPFEGVTAIYCSHCRRELAAAFVFCPYCATKRLGREPSHSLPASVVESEAVTQ